MLRFKLPSFDVLILMSFIAYCTTLCSCDIRPSLDRHLCEALGVSDTNYLNSYLISGGNVNRLIRYIPTEEVRTSLLNVGIRYGQVSSVAFLISHGADPNLRDPGGDTPLGWVIARSKNNVSQETQAAVVDLLLKAGANPNTDVSQYSGYTPLMAAANSGNTLIVKQLLAHGVDVNTRNIKGLSPLNFASSPEVVGVLLSAGASKSLSSEVEAPWETAAQLGHFRALAVLTNITWETNNKIENRK